VATSFEDSLQTRDHYLKPPSAAGADVGGKQLIRRDLAA
jgi:hypothetical protein